MYKNTKRIDTMFVQKKCQEELSMAKNYNASENSTNKNSYGSNKNAYDENASGKNQSNKNSGNKNASGKNMTNQGMQRMHMNQIVMHMTAQSPAITKVTSIKKCKTVKRGKAAEPNRCFFASYAP